MAEHLSEDLVAEILCRLPIKVLIRLKCVSRGWNSLISNVCVPRASVPLFGFLFKATDHPTQRKFYMDYFSYCGDISSISSEGFVESYSSLLPHEYSPYDMLDCCNGLILLGSRSVPRYYVCNPATKQCVAIPKLPEQVHVCHAALAFNPHESSHYRVIRFLNTINLSPSHPPRLSIFSSEIGTWKVSEMPIESPLPPGARMTKHTVYLDGVLYKVTFSKHLLSFDLKALKAQAIEFPHKDKTDMYGFIGVSKGVLNYSNSDESSFMIWHLDYHTKAGCFWILKHRISIHGLVDKHLDARKIYECRYSPMCKPYAIHPTSDIIFLGIPTMLFSYHLTSHSLELLHKRPAEGVILRGQYSLYPYSLCFIMLSQHDDQLDDSSVCPPTIETILKSTKDMKLDTSSDYLEDNRVEKATAVEAA